MAEELAVTQGEMLASSPAQYIASAERVAGALKKVIADRHLFVTISGRAHVHVEGWTLLANLLGVYPIVEWSRPIVREGELLGYEARVEVRNGQGVLMGAGESMCTRDEARWASRDEFALRAMAQTRAISRACRNPLGFVMKLAGYESTPAEEMPGDGDDHGGDYVR